MLLAASRTFSFMKTTTHQSSWAEPEAPGPRRDFSSRCAKARGEAALSLTSCAYSSCAFRVPHEGASRWGRSATKQHHNHFTWQVTLSQTASKSHGQRSQLEYQYRKHDKKKHKFNNNFHGRVHYCMYCMYIIILFLYFVLDKLVLWTGRVALTILCQVAERLRLVQRYKRHSVNFRFGTPMWISMLRVFLESFFVLNKS